jgi:FkbM family methyltransferase
MSSVVDSITHRWRFASERTREYQSVNGRVLEGLLFWSVPQRVADAIDLSCRFDVGPVTVRARRRDMVAVEEIGLRSEYSFVAEALKEVWRPIVVDAGANIGMFSALVLSLCDTAIVHSIEASRDTFRLLRRNQRANAALDWHPHQFALWDTIGHVQFEEGGMSTARRANDSGNGPSVRTRTLDRFVAEILPVGQRIHVCKLDIEGAEERVLRCSSTALGLIDQLIVEVHPPVCDERTIRTLLAEFFIDVKGISGRCSAKPLLHAFNSRSAAVVRTR